MEDLTAILVGQPAYFAPHAPTLPGWEFREYVYDVSPPSALTDLSADVLFFFRGEYISPDMLAAARGLKVMLSTEPMPRYLAARNGSAPSVETSPDRDAFCSKNFIRMASLYDQVYHFDPSSLSYLRRKGLHVAGTFRLPVNLDVYRPDPGADKPWDVFLFGKDTEHRRAMSGVLKHRLGVRFCHAAHGFAGPEFARLARRAKVGLNLHTDDLLSTEPRLYLYMACGLMVVSEPLSDNEILRPGEHYFEARGEAEITEACLWYAAHDRERERIARAGHAAVINHLDARKVWPAFARSLLREAAHA